MLLNKPKLRKAETKVELDSPARDSIFFALWGFASLGLSVLGFVFYSLFAADGGGGPLPEKLTSGIPLGLGDYFSGPETALMTLGLLGCASALLAWYVFKFFQLVRRGKKIGLALTVFQLAVFAFAIGGAFWHSTLAEASALPGREMAPQAVSAPLFPEFPGVPAAWQSGLAVLLVFVSTFLIGIVAVLAGIGGGVLFVPLASLASTLPLDMVRGTSIFMGIGGAIGSSPKMLRQGYVHTELLLPAALLASGGALLGAYLGLLLPETMLRLFIGFIMVLAALFMWKTPQTSQEVLSGDRLGELLGLHGTLAADGAQTPDYWRGKNTAWGMLIFIANGIIGGSIGVGAGWINVPLMTGLMKVPLPIAVATSSLVVAVSSTSAAWVYFGAGTVHPHLVIPALAGTLLGSRIGNRLFKVLKNEGLRFVVIACLALSAALSLIKAADIGF